MQKDILLKIRDFIVKNSRIVLPAAVVVVIAVTVAAALNLNRGRAAEGSSDPAESSAPGVSEGDTAVAEDIPLTLNEDSELSALVSTYQSAMTSGDLDTLTSLYDTLTEREKLKYAELSKYIDHYAETQIYTKPGPAENSYIVFLYEKYCFTGHEEEIPGYEAIYVCRNDQGAFYIKNELNITPEEEEYFKAVMGQADVVDLDTRVTVEYNDLMLEHPELLAYLDELGRQVDMTVGMAVAGVSDGDSQEGGEGEVSQGDQSEEPAAPPAEETPQFATATTTVNVRSSDSQQADKLGRVTTGTKLQVQEVRVNGWTKVVYEGKDGFIKSEYLQYSESASGQEVIGKVTATTNINVRASGSETAEKLGMLVGGESLDLLAVEGDWCKVVFEGQVAYVKAEYVQQQ